MTLLLNGYFWLILVVLALCIRLYIFHAHLKEFPVPPYVPFFGHYFDYVDPHKCLTTITNHLIKYGGVIRTMIGPQKPGLTVANRDFIEFLCNNSKHVCKSKYYNFLRPWLGEGLLTSDGCKWKSRRKALTASFTQTLVLKSFVEVFEQKGDLLMEILKAFEGEDIDVHPFIKRYTLDVICETAMGVSLSPQENMETKYLQSIDTISEIAVTRMTSFFKNFDFFYQFSEDCIKEKKALAVVDEFLEEIIEKKMQERLKVEYTSKRKDMLDLLMELKIDGIPLTKSDLREEINTFIFGGYDTTSVAVSFTLYEISIRPDIQERILEEQKQLFPNGLKNCKITFEGLIQMNYLEMVIKEALRLYTVVPTIGKRIANDLQYGEIILPSMLNFVIFLYGLHHMPKYFPEPEKFIPERFSDTQKVDPFTYMPFGVKPRQCLGKHYALLEIKSVISKIIRNFELTTIPGYQVKVIPKITLASLNGIRLKLRKRDTN